MKVRRLLAVCVLACGSAALAAAPSCQNEVRRTEDGPAPVITAIDPVSATVTPLKTDAGDLLACCTLSVKVTYDLPAIEFVRDAYVTWDDPRVRAARFEITVKQEDPPSDGGTEAGEGGADGGDDGGAPAPKSVGRVLGLDIDMPSQIVAKGVRFGYTITLVSGQGAVSLPVRASVTVE